MVKYLEVIFRTVIILSNQPRFVGNIIARRIPIT